MLPASRARLPFPLDPSLYSSPLGHRARGGVLHTLYAPVRIGSCSRPYMIGTGWARLPDVTVTFQCEWHGGGGGGGVQRDIGAERVECGWEGSEGSRAG